MRGGKNFLITIAVLMPFMLYAKVNVGIEVMPQLSTRISWSTGINLEIPLNEKLYISPGVYYSSRHRYSQSLFETLEYHPDGEIPIHYEKASINIYGDYINIPFLIGFKSFTHPHYTIKVAGGMYYAYLLAGKSKLKMDNNGEASQMLVPSYITVIGQRSDFGLCVEAKCLFHSHYQIGINLQHGLRKIYQGFDVQGIRDPAIFHHLSAGPQFHQSIGLSVGYVF